MKKKEAEKIFYSMLVGDSFTNSYGNNTEVIGMLLTNGKRSGFSLESCKGTRWDVSKSEFIARSIDGSYTDHTYPFDVNDENECMWEDAHFNEFWANLVKDQKLEFIDAHRNSQFYVVLDIRQARIRGNGRIKSVEIVEVLRLAENEKRRGWTKDYVKRKFLKGKLKLISQTIKEKQDEKSRPIKTNRQGTGGCKGRLPSESRCIAVGKRLTGNGIKNSRFRSRISSEQIRETIDSF